MYLGRALLFLFRKCYSQGSSYNIPFIHYKTKRAKTAKIKPNSSILTVLFSISRLYSLAELIVITKIKREQDELSKPAFLVQNWSWSHFLNINNQIISQSELLFSPSEMEETYFQKVFTWKPIKSAISVFVYPCHFLLVLEKEHCSAGSPLWSVEPLSKYWEGCALEVLCCVLSLGEGINIR